MSGLIKKVLRPERTIDFSPKATPWDKGMK